MEKEIHDEDGRYEHQVQETIGTVGEKAEKVNSRSDLVSFIYTLRKYFDDSPERWQNLTVPDYLYGLASWLEDCDGLYENLGKELPDTPSWKFVGELLFAASMYE